MKNTTVRSTVDHLVVLAATLEDGVRWCEALLGVTPEAGGEHPLMGTHNCVINISSFSFPDCYLEIMALNPGAPMQRAAGQKRWFDMDNVRLQSQLAQHGPQLVHFVVRCPDAQAGVDEMSTLGLDCGTLVNASRRTPAGLLQWRMTVRDDGQRLMGGTVPALIQWGAVGEIEPRHPTRSMPYSDLQLQGLQLNHTVPVLVETICESIGLNSMQVQSGLPGICATLQTPRGLVRLSSPPSH
jgi:hypothetical protein